MPDARNPYTAGWFGCVFVNVLVWTIKPIQNSSVYFHQALRASLAQFQHPLEASQVTVIGVGHLDHARRGGKLQEQVQFAQVLRWAKALQRFQIGLVHGQDQIEPFEVLLVYTPRARVAGLVIAA